MQTTLRCLAALLAFTPLAPAQAAEKSITRELLLKGVEIPEQRVFPLSAKVKPCEDFHRYVCEEVENNFSLPPDRASWTFSLMDNHERLLGAQRNYSKLLGEGYAPRTERARQIKDFYLACMDPEANAREERSLLASEKEKVAAINSRAELIGFLGANAVSPDQSLLSVDSFPKLADPNYFDIIVTASALTLPDREYYNDSKVTAGLEEVMVSFFKAAGLDQAEARARAVLDFERGLAKVSPPKDQVRQRITQPRYRTRAELGADYPNVSFEALFRAVPATVSFRDLIPETLRYLSDAQASLPLDTLKSIYLWQELRSQIDDSNPQYYDQLFRFNRLLGGPAQRAVREKRCAAQAAGTFGPELDAELLPILFPNFPKDRVKALAERVRASIVKGLKDNEWLSDSSRAEAIKKIATATLQLVEPERTEDWNFLPEAKYDAEAPLTNQRRVKQAKIDRELARASEKRNRRLWLRGPLTVNASYMPSNNAFTLFQGILQSPFFDPAMADHQVLGAIGMVVGHELGHAIDDQGSKYDFEGKLRTWKTAEDEAEFSRRTQGFVELFDRLGHNGKLTLGENIGDHEGLTFSFATAFPNPREAPAARVQEFFTSYARNWCTKSTPEADKRKLATDPHSLGWARINAQVKQLAAFHEAFGCKEGDAMYLPEAQRIRIW